MGVDVEALFTEDVIERAAKASYTLGVTTELYGVWEDREEEVKELYREDVRIVVEALKAELNG